MSGQRYTSRDGLCSSIDPEVVALWDQIGARMDAEKADWTTRLRAMGVKLAHPDDGWVHRDAQEPYLSLSWYPQFNDHPAAGDLIALGAPYHHGRYDGDKRDRLGRWQYRLVRVTRVEISGYLIPYTDFYFTDTGVRLPPAPPTPSRLRRALALFGQVNP